MSGFDSPNFKKSVASSQQRPLREFNVGAPEDFAPATQTIQQGPVQNVSELEAQIVAARKEKLATYTHGERISETAKRRIEILANIGRLSKDVKIGDYTFSIRTLKAKETREAALATFASVKTDLEASFEARKQQLARSIHKIDGEDVEVVLVDNSMQNIFELMDNLEETVMGRLWDEFTLLKEEAKNKYGINTAKEAEEVAEDLKK